jgi:hypothetical protein
MTKTNARLELAQRVRAVRVEVYGEHGAAFLAKQLNLPVRTWLNFETGVAITAEIILQFMALTNANPNWLLRGKGERYL